MEPEKKVGVVPKTMLEVLERGKTMLTVNKKLAELKKIEEAVLMTMNIGADDKGALQELVKKYCANHEFIKKEVDSLKSYLKD
jgi:hypothetical protein